MSALLKLPVWLSTRTALALVVAATSVRCGEPQGTGVRTYTMQGQVISVALDRKEALVKHEAIAGLMEAMTMPYSVRDAKALAALQPGDLITSTLVVADGDGAYLRDIRIVGDAPLERPSGATTGATASPPSDGAGALHLLVEGDATPNATFIDQDGKTRDFASFRGSTVVVTFIYTKCPLPTFCPLMDRHFAAVQSKLLEEPALKGVHLVTVSFDPTSDTPEVLKRHATSLGADPARWTFLTGDRADIEAFAGRFGVYAMRETDAVDITHNLRTAIVDANGVFVKAYTGNDWTPAQLLADLSRLGR